MLEAAAATLPRSTGRWHTGLSPMGDVVPGHSQRAGCEPVERLYM